MLDPRDGQIDALQARVAALEAERDKAQENYQFMVERAADQKLDGYRELGARAAAAERERDTLRARVAELEAEVASVLRAEIPEPYVAHLLREQGWLCISPNDPAPLAELVRAAVAYVDAGSRLTEPMRMEGLECPTRAAEALSDAANAAASDPAICRWVERGRDGT